MEHASCGHRVVPYLASSSSGVSTPIRLLGVLLSALAGLLGAGLLGAAFRLPRPFLQHMHFLSSCSDRPAELRGNIRAAQ